MPAVRETESTPKIVQRCRALVSHPAFEPAVLAVILINAVVLGLNTFPNMAADYQRPFEMVYQVIFALYVVELLIRITAAGWSLRAFAADKWNLFDFFVVVVVLLPTVQTTVMVIRLIRLARIVRVIRFLPDLHVIMIAIVKSIRGMASLAAATALLLYIYAMLGWVFFSAKDPDHYGNIGLAMLTMFVMLTLENLPDNVEMGQQVSQWSILFFISYVLIMSFLIFNLFIGIVVGAMEEARSVDKSEREVDDLPTRLRSAKSALEDAERELERIRGVERKSYPSS